MNRSLRRVLPYLVFALLLSVLPASHSAQAYAQIDARHPRMPVLQQAALPTGVVTPTITRTVQAIDNIFNAGQTTAQGGGAFPSAIPIPEGSNRVLTFSGVNGNTISCCGTSGPHGADGGPNLQTYIVPNVATGLSGIRHTSRNMFLVGVFLTDLPPTGPPPDTLRFSATGALDMGYPTTAVTVAELQPLVGQVFYIGDGKTGEQTGAIQRFIVPDGATRFYLGFADALNLGDPTKGTPSPALPASYEDNTGSVTANMQIEYTPPPLSLTVTDATGRPVEGLVLNDQGWPVLNADGSNTLANPLTITAVITNNSLLIQEHSFTLNVGQLAGDQRFHLVNEPNGCLELSEPYLPGSLLSLIRRNTACTVNLASGESKTFTWSIWIQPSLAGHLPITGELRDNTGTLLAEQEHPISIPKSAIRPVVFLPGFFGSMPRVRGGSTVAERALDPINQTYDGFLTYARTLGYEDNLTLIPFPYRWYEQTIDDAAAELDGTLDGWWSSHQRPSYVHASEFDLTAHSTGGLIIRDYVRLFGASRVHNVGFVATPQQGAPMAFGAYEGLDPQNNPDGYDSSDDFMRAILRLLAAKAGCKTSLIDAGDDIVRVNRVELYTYMHGLPCPSTTVSGDDVSTTTSGAHIGVPMLRELIPSDSSTILASATVSTTVSFPRNTLLDQINTSAALNGFLSGVSGDGGQIIQLYSDGLKTTLGYTVSEDLSFAPLWQGGTIVPTNWTYPVDAFAGAQAPNRSGYQIEGRGDQVVPRLSADLRKLTFTSAFSSTITTINDKNVSHISFFFDSSTNGPLRQLFGRLVAKELSSEIWRGSLPDAQISTGQNIGAAGIALFNHCPVTMLITDQQGRRLGTTPDGQQYEEIADSYYSGHDPQNGPDILWLPAAIGSYTVTVTGIKPEPYQIDSQLFSTTGVSGLGLFTGLLQTGEVVTHTFAYTPARASMVLLVNDSSDPTLSTRYLADLQTVGAITDLWDVAQRGAPTVNDLYPYRTVVWVTGAGSFLPERLSAIEPYVAFGGSILLTGAMLQGAASWPTRFQTTFGVDVNGTSPLGTSVTGSDLLTPLSLALTPVDMPTTSFIPQAQTTTLGSFEDPDNSTQIVATRYTDGASRRVLLGFALDRVANTTVRQTALARILRWVQEGAFPSTPTINAGGPYTVDEGGSITLTATGNDPLGGVLRYSWDLTGDGTFATVGQTVTFNAGNIDGPVVLTIPVRVTSATSETAEAVATISVVNRAPEIVSMATESRVGVVGEYIGGVAQVRDVVDSITSATWDWGGGAFETAYVFPDGTVLSSHRYAAPGVYTATLTIEDDDGAITAQSIPVTVVTPLQVTLTGATTMPEGGQTTLAVQTDRPATVDWDLDGDGSFETIGVQVTVGAGGLDGPGVRTVAVRAVDADDVTTVRSIPITVTNAPPLVGSITSPAAPFAPTLIGSFQVSVTDPGATDTQTAVWTWGDGSTSVGEVSANGGGWLVRGSHAYTAAGSYQIRVTVTDDDGASSTAQQTITVSGTVQAVSPVLECVATNTDGTYTAWFGYRNTNSASVPLAVGTRNKFTPNPTNRNQPTLYAPGRQVRVFGVTWNGSGNLVWTLDGRTSTASRTSTACR